MAILALKGVARAMRKLHCSDAMMAAACAEIAAGLTDADLGSNLYKKRIPIEGRGKSGGLRTIIASRFNGRWFILAILEKSDLVNIPSDQLRCLKQQTVLLLELEDAAIEKLIANGYLVRILDESSTTQGV